MRVVASLPTDDWKETARLARAYEAAGYDSLTTAELAHDPFAPLAVAATVTGRVTLATAIAVAFPRSPMIVAGQAWDLQANSGGRFSLGLGTQVKGHNERRYSTPWGPPVERTREYVQSLRAIWRTWETGEKLDFKGTHYSFTLMTPEFSPRPTGLPMVPVTVAAVGPDMLRMTGRIADGVRLHGFCTRKYMQDQVIPRVGEGLAKSGRDRARFRIIGGGFIATGPDADAVREKFEWVRYRVAFYGSTRTYQPVFQTHGIEELGRKLHQLSVAGKWDIMAREVPDDVVRLFAAVAPYKDLAPAIEARFGGISDEINLTLPPATPEGLMKELLADVKRIPTPFAG
ncbi:MAG: TIGR03617 family F420-dependent LLM class oxidoreductase [Alphaproteobacteria bacterium]|nr:TIGR03617 family F420-dependent LLM class oxidoreductase [Alphaproteobacteria bacterium]